MALANTFGAIGAVTDVVIQRLKETTAPTLDVSLGRPEPNGNTGARLNLFLYEVQFDASLKNVPLDEGQAPPVWLVLKYLMTAFDDEGKGETIQAYEHLGNGIRALQGLSLLSLADLSTTLTNPLSDNPEDLKVTFDEAPTDLLAKVMQGSEEKYRLSVAFQVRPVMIAPAQLPSYSLLVGVDYTPPAPPRLIGTAGIHIPVIPSLGSTITEVSPSSFELDALVTLKGTDLHLDNLSVKLGPVELPVTMQRPDQLQFVVRSDIATPAIISAGSLPVAVSQLLSTGRRRLSNALIGNLRPSVAGAVVGPISTVSTAPPLVGWKFATIRITGELLGKNDVDDFYLSLYKDGTTFAMLDAQDDLSPGTAPQTQRRFQMNQADAVPPGRYLAIYRVNGQQALQSDVIDLTV